MGGPDGLVGVTLEAATVNGWAGRLTPQEAEKAVSYATLEINGFPPWLSDLVAMRPDEVRVVLASEILHEITTVEIEHRQTLQAAAHASDEIARLLSPAMLDHLLAGGLVLPRGPIPCAGDYHKGDRSGASAAARRVRTGTICNREQPRGSRAVPRCGLPVRPEWRCKSLGCKKPVIESRSADRAAGPFHIGSVR